MMASWMRDVADPGTRELIGGQLVGYARVSTTDQDTTLQTNALHKAGVVRIFEDVASGAKDDRPGLAAATAFLREGDTLTVWRLDRLGRSLPHLVHTVAELAKRGVGFQSLTENIDTTTASGRLQFHLFAALADFERDLIRERTRAGLAVAKARGRNGGRRPVITPAKLAQAHQLIDGKGLTVREAAGRLHVGKTSLYHALTKAS